MLRGKMNGVLRLPRNESTPKSKSRPPSQSHAVSQLRIDSEFERARMTCEDDVALLILKSENN